MKSKGQWGYRGKTSLHQEAGKNLKVETPLATEDQELTSNRYAIFHKTIVQNKPLSQQGFLDCIFHWIVSGSSKRALRGLCLLFCCEG